MPPDQRDQESDAEQQRRDNHCLPVSKNQKNGAKQRRHENVPLAEQRAKITQIGAEHDKRGKRHENGEAAAEE